MQMYTHRERESNRDVLQSARKDFMLSPFFLSVVCVSLLLVVAVVAVVLVLACLAGFHAMILFWRAFHENDPRALLAT